MGTPLESAPRAHPLAALRRLARPRALLERCELCAAPLSSDHQHVIEPATRQVTCACDACAILFGNQTRLRRIPRDAEYWPDFVLPDAQWEALGVPIALAFFFRSSAQDHLVTMYPSPGGATEAVLAEDVWNILCADNPQLATLEADVEALLVNRMRGARDYYRAPIDECFRLVGLVRAHWRGLSGGRAMWDQFDIFFRKLRERAGKRTHA
ncbi:MAG TPA: DUF5947 family protein [Phycisphaerae bacterium]|nr:DUF5947 family protein [Phycisphaerae bacterium]